MKVAAADLAITKTGLARVDGTLATITPTEAGYKRHRPMAAAVIRELGKADLVILEGYDPHPRGALALIRAAELGGIVRAGVEELRIAWLDVPPSTLKRFATGKGNAPKTAMTAAARAAGATITTDDEADAYFLRLAGYHLHALAFGLEPHPATVFTVTAQGHRLDPYGALGDLALKSREILARAEVARA